AATPYGLRFVTAPLAHLTFALSPYTTLFRSQRPGRLHQVRRGEIAGHIKDAAVQLVGAGAAKGRARGDVIVAVEIKPRARTRVHSAARLQRAARHGFLVARLEVESAGVVKRD